MSNMIFFGICLILVFCIITCFLLYKTKKYFTDITKTLSYQYNLIVKIQSVLKNKNATNAVAENSEIIYQDLLQNLIPIMAAIDIMPRSTNEHPLWRALGGIIDEYAKNPFVLEKLRRQIKLNNNIAHNIDNYLFLSNKLLQYLTTTEPDGLLVSTFTNGLLGQSLTFFTQAKELAMHNEQ